jgi:hypothetical protein
MKKILILKSHLVTVTAFLLVLAGSSTSCQKPEPDPNGEKPIDYPTGIPFTELEKQCQWINLAYDSKIILINSNEELEKHITCIDNSNFPAIDFSEHTLLLVSGKTNNGICEINAINLQQLSVDRYELNIEITLNDATDIEEWATAFIVKKLNERSNVELKVTTEVVETKIILPVTVTDQRIIDFFVKCRFTGKSSDSHSSCFFTTQGIVCLAINTMDEFRHIYECTDDLPEIDFDNYTLIIGKQGGRHSAVFVSDQKIIENCALTFYLELDIRLPGLCEPRPIHYWGIYPKLPNKAFNVKYEIIY